MSYPGSFDQAASFYDATRGFPPGIGDQVAAAAQALLAGRTRVLEVGVGTGRIARQLLARGVPVIGLDLSRKMMDQLLAALPPGLGRPALVQAQAEHLPLAAGSLEAILTVHVFHLIPDWQAAVSGMVRALGPGGLLLSGYEWRPAEAPGARLMEQWRRIVQARAGDVPGPARGPAAHDFADIKAALIAAGTAYREVLVGEWTTTRTLARHLETIEHRTWSATWHVPEAFFGACLADLRAWAIAEYGSLDQPIETPHRFVWEVYSLPPSPA